MCIAAYLELVLAGLGGRAGVQQINGENLQKTSVSITACLIVYFHPAHRCPVPFRKLPRIPSRFGPLAKLRSSAPKFDVLPTRC
jgi:hypothetical protein